MAQGVTYSLAAFKRAGFGEGGGFMQLQCKGGDPTALRLAMDAATLPINRWLEDSAEVDPDVDGYLGDARIGPDGPVVRLERVYPQRILKVILDRLVDELSGAGLVGRLAPLPPAPDHYWGSGPGWPALGVTWLLPVEQERLAQRYSPPGLPNRRPTGWPYEWDVDFEVTAVVVAPLVAWALEVLEGTPARKEAGQVSGEVRFMVVGDTVALPAEMALEAVLATLPTEPMVRLRAWVGTRRCRTLEFSAGGMVNLSSYDLDRPRVAHLADLTELMRGSARYANQCFVREIQAQGGGERDVLHRFGTDVPLPETVRHELAAVAHLEGEYVYAAQLRQVLTDAQLGRTRDLSAWDVEDLGHGRHLVTVPDYEAWLDPRVEPEPDERGHIAIHRPPAESIERATADLGDAVLTLEDLHGSVPPFTADHAEEWAEYWEQMLRRVEARGE